MQQTQARCLVNPAAESKLECAGTRSFRLSRDGGAVLLQNPDGTERLMLLVSDLQRAKQDLQRREKEAARQQAVSPETYEVQCCINSCHMYWRQPRRISNEQLHECEAVRQQTVLLNLHGAHLTQLCVLLVQHSCYGPMKCSMHSVLLPCSLLQPCSFTNLVPERLGCCAGSIYRP